MILTGGFDGFDVIDSRFWWFWQVVLMVLMFWQQVLMALMFWQQVLMFLMILTGGFCFWRLYNKWQQVLMFLMILTAGFDDFDRWFWWFWCFDSRFWWFWQVVLMVLTAGFDSRFWWFWQVVFVFEGCIINHFIDRRFRPLKTLLSGNSPPTRWCVSGAVLWKTVKASPTNICYFKTKSWLFIE